MQKKPPRKGPMSLRLEPELERRLEECARRIKKKKHSLAQDAIEAAVEAIEQNDYRIVMPIAFDVTHVPVPKKDEPQPSAQAAVPSAVPSRSTAVFGLIEEEQPPVRRVSRTRVALREMHQRERESRP